jgi:hypothetical protein
LQFTHLDGAGFKMFMTTAQRKVLDTRKHPNKSSPPPSTAKSAPRLDWTAKQCRQCGSVVDRPWGRRCRRCYNLYYFERRRCAFMPVRVRLPQPAPYDCKCGKIECDTCGDRMLQTLLDKRPQGPPEERSWLGIARFA